MKKKLIALLFVLTTLFVLCSGSALAAERDSISVTGHASAEVAPDMATVYGSLEKRAASAEAAREDLAGKMADFKRMLLVQMIPDQDIQTVHYSLQPEYIYDKNKRKLTGYIASANYRVKIRDLEKLSLVMDKSINCGLAIDRVEFGLNNRSLVENSLLDDAVANAKAKAAVVARAGGRTLGYLIRASLGTVTSPVRNMNRNMLMAKTADMADMESTPTELDPGVITVNADVSLEFALE